MDEIWGTSSPAVGADGTTYVHFGTKLYAIDRLGSVTWEYDANSIFHSSPAIGADGNVLFTASGVLYAISPDGNLEWSYPVQGTTGTPPTIGSDGTVYLTAVETGTNPDRSWLYAVATSSGGLADSPWPKFMHDLGNSGNAATR